MKHALIGLLLFVAGAALGTWWSGHRAANSTSSGTPTASVAGAPSSTPAAGVAAQSPDNANAGAATGAARYALQAWEGCRPLDGGEAFTGPTTRTLTLSNGKSMEVALAPTTRVNGTLVFDTLVKGAIASTRTQTAFNGPLLVDGVLLRPVDLDAVTREVSGDAAYLHGPHPMQQ